MPARIRSHAQTVVVAVIAAAVTAGAPAIAHGVHARFAHNADKVDNKHAVSSSATVNNRKGKLVATNPTTGLLPNNIIAKAMDAERLDGLDSGDFSASGHNHDAAYYALGSKVADSELLDGLNSSAFASAGHNHNGVYVSGPGRLRQAAVAILNDGFANPVLEVPGFFRTSLNCQAGAGNSVTRFRNLTGGDMNVFYNNGGTDPVYFQLAANGANDQFANAAGEFLTWQIHSPSHGVATIWMMTVNRAGDCHAQAQAIMNSTS